MVSPASAGLGAGQAPAAAPQLDESFTATGGQTVFGLAESYVAGGIAILTVNGQRWFIGTDFTIVGTTLTWLDTPWVLEAGDIVLIAYNHA